MHAEGLNSLFLPDISDEVDKILAPLYVDAARAYLEWKLKMTS